MSTGGQERARTASREPFTSGHGHGSWQSWNARTAGKFAATPAVQAPQRIAARWINESHLEKADLDVETTRRAPHHRKCTLRDPPYGRGDRMSADDFQKGLTGATSVELYGPEDGGWYTTRVHDWIALCPFLRDPDVRAYLVLRALVLEKYKNPVRKLTLAVLCELIPGPNGKPSSLTRVRSMLAGLSSVGLICTPEGGPVKTSSRTGAAQRTMRLRINDMPAE